MTSLKAESIITISGMVTFGSVTAKRLSDGQVPSGRQIASTCLAFAALGAVATAAPDIAAGLAIATGATAFVTYGLPMLIKFYPDSQYQKDGYTK